MATACAVGQTELVPYRADYFFYRADKPLTVAGLGTVAGAWQSPELEIVPTVLFPPGVPFTCHVTEVLMELDTVAINCCAPLTARLADVGDMVTKIVGAEVGELRELPPPPPHPTRKRSKNNSNNSPTTSAVGVAMISTLRRCVGVLFRDIPPLRLCPFDQSESDVPL